MGFFQNSVLKKYLEGQNIQEIKSAYKQFSTYFHNPVIQQNIRDAKEEQFQEGFLRELFVNVLGYTLNPNPNYNLTTELKNEKGAKKADGAILQNGKALGVIELKGTDTKDLDKINSQAFNYKNNQTGCIYIITSNFEKLRFFIQNAVEHLEFNLFTLKEEEFEVLWLCLQSENLFSGVALKIKEDSLQAEEKITKQLYNDYSDFKTDLWQNLVKNSPETDKLLLFKKSQKLLDRFLFILFAEDKGLLPPNSIREILKQWEKLKELDEYRPLYDRFKKYFGYLNTGWRGKEYEIFAYNGGLFLPDDVLDEISIDDEVLKPHISNLTRYDFESEVDVNILGHIFEHSLSEIEVITAELEGRELEKTTSKRKKDGVFYTPKHITKYIVDSTLGRLCEEKKIELEISDDVYEGVKKRSRKRIENLQAYRNWLLELTICDPACGSGAFLNQALEFLINEHRYLDELTAKYHGASLILSDIENHILEKNIYGVDINEESVEIAKLSLWLRTAKRGRKLTSLNKNIKCGNSLINNPEIAGEKFFIWESEFPNVFKKGGFDVIIGNPPWGAKVDKDSADHLVTRYPVVPTKLKDTYMYFQLLSIDILSDKGILGLLIPNTWLLINNTADYRQELLSYNILEIIDHGDGVFEEAIVESSSIVLKKAKVENGLVLSKRIKKGKEVLNHFVKKQYWLEDNLKRIVLELNERDYKILKKIESRSKPFIETSEIIFGIKPYQVGHGTPPQTKEIINERRYHSEQKVDEEWFPLLVGTDVNRYTFNFPGNQFIKYGKWLMYASDENKMKNPKLLLRRTSHDLKVAYDDQGYFGQNSLFIITSSLSLKYLMALLNSKLFDFIYKSKCPQIGKIFAEVKPSIIKELPIVEANTEIREKIELKATELSKRMLDFDSFIIDFLNLLHGKLEISANNKKLNRWHELSLKDFLKELKNEKVNLSLNDEAQWVKYFNEQKQLASSFLNDTKRLDKEIDKIIYQLYGLKEEEIKVIECH